MKKHVLLALAIVVSCNLMAQTFSSVAPSGQTLYYRINAWDATLTYDGGCAYQGLTGSLVIPGNVSYNGHTYPVAMIDSGCFRGNVGLTSITIPVQMRQICYNAFAGCTSLTTINYNADSCALGRGFGAWDDAYNAGIFEGCVNVTTVNIGDSVRYVPPFVFYDCIGLQTLNVGKSVIKFHNDALPYEPTNLTTLNFNARRCESYYSNSSHQSQYYDYTSGEYRSFKEYSPFQNCTSLTNVTIGDEVESLFSRFFLRCTGLTSVVIPDAVISMRYCFQGCTNLNTVTVGSSVEQMQGAFDFCSHLTTINVRAEYPPTCNEYTFNDVPSYADIIVPCGAAYRYQLTDYWNEFTRITEDCDHNAINRIDEDDIKVYTNGNQIVVSGATEIIRIRDMIGRIVAETKDAQSVISVPQTGICFISIDNHPARKVIVIR